MQQNIPELQVIPELQALKWAAYPDVPPPGVERLDEVSLRLLLQHHGLTRRFVERAMRERPRWGRGVFLAAQRLAGREVEAHVRRHIAEMQRLMPYMGVNTPLPIVFKGGMAVYALTGDPRTLRPSGDIDLLAPDARALANLLPSAGYQEDAAHSEGDHEEATLHRGNITIEVHRYFISTVCAPSGFQAEAVPPPLGITPLEDAPARRQAFIRYADVAEDARPGVTAETQGLLFPSPAMLALILCCHIFNHTVYQPTEHHIYVEPRIFLRLAEVADVDALMQHPDFDESRFSRLCERFEAHASVTFARMLIQSYFQEKTGPTLKIPLGLYLRGCAFLETTPDALLIDSAMACTLRQQGDRRISAIFDRDLGTTLDRMGANPIILGAEPTAPTRLIVRSKHRAPFPVLIQATQEEGGVVLTVHLPERLAQSHWDYHLMLLPHTYGHTEMYYASIPVEEAQWHESGKGHGELTGNGAGYTLAIHLPYSIDRESSETCPVLLHLMVWDHSEDIEDEIDPMLVIPLQIGKR